MPDATVEPRTTVLLRGTQPNYVYGRADGVGELMGLLCIPVRTTYHNGWVVNTTVNWGSGDADSDTEVAIREIDLVNPNTSVPYDKTAVTVAGDSITLHYLIAGDEIWAKVTETVALGNRLTMSTTAGCLDILNTGTTDDYQHEFMCLRARTGAGYTKVRYLGVFTGDITD